MALPIIAAGALGSVAAVFARYFVGYMIVRVIVALGISLITYTALDSVASFIQSQIITNVGSTAGDFANFLDGFGITQALNIITSAYIGAITIRQLFGAFNKITLGAFSQQ